MNILPADRQAAIVAAYEAGETARQVAMRFGCTADTVLRTIRRAGVTPRARGRYVDADLIIKLRRAGVSYKDVVKITGCSSSTVCRISKRAGVAWTPKASLGEIIHLYTVEGLSAGAIGTRLGISGSHVIHCLKRAGVPRRDRLHAHRQTRVQRLQLELEQAREELAKLEAVTA